MDFLNGLPRTFYKHDVIWVVIFCFSKMAPFIPCTKTTSAMETMELFFTRVWSHFGLPTSIISDHTSCFLSTFGKMLWSLLGCHLQFSTTFHPQSDSQTGVVNHSLGHALHMYFFKNKQWDVCMHVIQHSYNRFVQLSTSLLPFEAFYGYQTLSPYEFPLTMNSEGTFH